MPDIDMDFDERRRGEMIRYTTEKYGEDRIAQIITYSTIKAKAAIKDSARVLFGQPGYAVADRISKAMPPAVMGKDIPLSGVFDPAHKRYSEATEVRALYEIDPQVKEIIDTARGLEGLKRQWGVHAAGVIMSSTPLIDVIPIQRRDSDGAIITQFDMGACETLGLLKMDFLGLRNLTIIDDALENIELNGKPTLVIEDVELDDQKTYELLAKGETLGVFQLDGGPMRDLLRRMASDRVRRHLRRRRAVPARSDGRERAQRLRGPQEQAARGHADPPGAGRAPQGHPGRDLRPDRLPGTGHGDRAEARRLHARQGGPAPPRDGQEEEGDPRQGVRRLRPGHEGQRLLRGRGQDALGHPRSRSPTTRSTRRTPPRTAWSPTGPPTSRRTTRPSTWPRCSPRSATTRTSPPSTSPSAGGWASRCSRRTSTTRCATSPRSAHDIRFGLGAIRNVGANVVDSIVAARKEKGEFTDFSDFLRKVDAVVCNKKVIESLVKAGAFDSLGHPRKGLLLVHADAVDAVMSTKKAASMGQFDLFGSMDGSGGTGSRGVRRQDARRGVGRQAPARRRAGDARPLRVRPPAQRRRAGAGVLVGHFDRAILEGDVAGRHAGHRRRHPRRGEPPGEQERRAVGVGADRGPRRWHRGAVLPASYQVHRHVDVAEDAIVLVKARVNKRDDRISLIANDLVVPDLATPATRRPAAQGQPAATSCTPESVTKLKEVLSAPSGHVRGAPQPGQRQPHHRADAWTTRYGSTNAPR